MNSPDLLPALDLRGRRLVLDKTRIMGVLNVTPDSFSDGGKWLEEDAALRHALDMVADGADILDIGGESTRPGAQPVSTQEEIERVVPLIERLSRETDCPISVDTSKPEVMRESVRAGASMINDVFALRQEGALETAAELEVPVCIMHMQGEPRVMQQNPQYTEVVSEVTTFLTERAAACEAAGIDSSRIVIDPGFGFGKSLEHNLALFRALPELAKHGYPVLVGVSRKSMLGAITGKDTADRVASSVTAAVLAAQAGAAIVRVHDVAETADALKLLAAIER